MHMSLISSHQDRRARAGGSLARHTRGWVVAALLIVATLNPAASAAQAATPDPFYTYTGAKPLQQYKPGAVLRTRSVTYSLLGVPVPIRIVQILYRTTDARGRAIAGVTSVLKPPLGQTTKVISYQSFYDSLNPEDGPSRAYTGGRNIGGLEPHIETGMFAALLLQGYAINVSDTEGPTADFLAGTEYGQVTLDSIRAALAAPGTGIVGSKAKVGLLGYSGGSIATNWAAVLAPTYAPDINERLVGAAEGGVFVRPATNLAYIDGSLVWSGIIPMMIIGMSRALDFDMTPYLSEFGRDLVAKMQQAPIILALGSQPGLTWAKMTKPEYSNPESIPAWVKAMNKLNLGTRPNPTTPMFIGQGVLGEPEGTVGNKPGIGAGDGVMVAGDVRSLARKYCAGGVPVIHREYPLTHIPAAATWLVDAIPWLQARFRGVPAPTNCATLKPGNDLGTFGR